MTNIWMIILGILGTMAVIGILCPLVRVLTLPWVVRETTITKTYEVKGK